MAEIALITGSSRGIGKVISQRFKDEGYKVIDTHHTHWQPNSLCINLANPRSINDQVRYVIEQHGQIDVLVNNAGVSQRKDFMELTPFDLDYMWQVNVRGTMLITQAVLRSMLPRKYGKIINISSVGGVVRGVEQVHYATTKAAIINFTKSLARLYGNCGINTNCISPGIINTEMLEGNKRLTDDIPCGRIGSPDDVANAVLFLADDKSDYINGDNIIIDGGLILK